MTSKLRLGETLNAGGKVDYHRRTQVGRALHELGVQMIPAYSPEARRVRWPATLAGCEVVHQHLNGTLSLTHGTHCLGCYDTGGAPLPAKVSTGAVSFSTDLLR